MSNSNATFKPLKWSFFLLTTLYIFLQFYLISFKFPFDIAYNNKTAGFFAIYINKLTTSFALWPPLIGFFGAHILIQSLFTIIIYFVIKEAVKISQSLSHNVFLWAVLFWFICQVNIFLWNSYLFPYSFFSMLIHSHWLSYFLFILTNCIIVVVLAIVGYRLIFYHRRLSILVTLMLLVFVAASYAISRLSSPHFFAIPQKPNVIIIITDSLRPDYAKQNKVSNPLVVQKLINHAAFFANSLTLLGRSTPGLVTILTGNYPKTNGARFNLISDRYLHLNYSLTKILKSQGYQTIFAADGRQFINLDQSFEFDQIISAHAGIYDFIFTLINDTPLSNLLMNTPLGQHIFPYNYANRNSYYTYLPNSFVRLVDKKLVNKDPKKPVLFIAALTTAHWPYVWARQPNFEYLSGRYEDSVLQLDKQFAELFKLLDKRGLLTHSIIVTLSDHGDSLGLPGDRIITEKNFIGPKNRLSLITRYPYMTKQPGKAQLIGIDTSAGHGTDLLSMTQLQTTLAFFQQQKINPLTITQRVALIDVTPTLLDLLSLSSSIKFDGISLQPVMFGKSNLKEFNRPIFLESEIDIPLIDITKKNNHSTASRLINQYANLYDIDLNTQQLVLKDNAILRLLYEKQRGVIFGPWLLVHFPGKNTLQTEVIEQKSSEIKNCYYFFPTEKNQGLTTKLFCYRLSPTRPYFVLVNLITQKWQVFFAEESATNPTFNLLLQKLKSFYGPLLVE